MTATPRSALARCEQSRLLRTICPHRVPFALDQRAYYLADGCANAPHITIASPRCELPVWSYEVFAPIPGEPRGATVSAWDGHRWFVPSYAPVNPPPYQVHVDIQAADGAPPVALTGSGFAGARPERVTDQLLNPARTHPAALGEVRWFGQTGKLVFAPTNANGGGEEAGHVMFAFRRNRTYYDISLHAWASKERFVSHGRARVITAPQSGPALAHVVATLKALVGSALAP